MRQIDYIFVSEIMANTSKANIHQQQTPTIALWYVRPRSQITPEARTVKRPRVNHVRRTPRPLSWNDSDPMFNPVGCDVLRTEAEDRLGSGLSPSVQVAAYHTFTHGSFIRGQGAE